MVAVCGVQTEVGVAGGAARRATLRGCAQGDCCATSASQQSREFLKNTRGVSCVANMTQSFYVILAATDTASRNAFKKSIFSELKIITFKIWDSIILIMNLQVPKLLTVMVEVTIGRTLFIELWPDFCDLRPLCVPNLNS